VTIEKGELATSIKERKENEIHLLGSCWERQTTFIFGMLVNVGKKIMWV